MNQDKLTVRVSGRISRAAYSMLEYHQKRMGARTIAEVVRRHLFMLDVLCGPAAVSSVSFLIEMHFPKAYSNHVMDVETSPKALKNVNLELDEQVMNLLRSFQIGMVASSLLETLARVVEFFQTVLDRLDTEQELSVDLAISNLFKNKI